MRRDDLGILYLGGILIRLLCTRRPRPFSEADAERFVKSELSRIRSNLKASRHGTH